MAITINSTPEAYPSAHDDLYFVVGSNNYTQAGFKYVFDVYISSTLVTRIKLFPDPATTKGIFNAGSVVRSYLNGYFKPNSTPTAFAYTGNDLYINYEIRFGEDYGGTTYTNLTSGQYRAFNFVNPIFRDWTTSYYQPKINTWLTGRDVTKGEVTMTERLFAGFMNTAATTTNLTLTVQKYRESGATDGSSATGNSVACSAFVLFDLSPAAINTYLGSSLINAATYQYGVRVNYGGNQSPEFRVKLVCNPRWTPVSIHFLNKLGGYDTFAFRMVNRREGNAEKKSYEQLGWQYNAGSMTRYDSYKRINAGNNTFAVNETVQFKLTSDYINETDYLWLKDLITSPEVYYEDGGYYYPVSIKTTNWAEKKRIADKMFNFDLSVEFAQKINSQYR
jgi:hypothetical protein